MSARGMFITFEGGDGAGKTVQANLLADHLRGSGGTVLRTREPGGTPLGAKIRELLLHGGAVDPKAEALLFAADRAHHIATTVEPALAAGQFVVQDRYIDSSVAYQGAGRTLDTADVAAISRWATNGLTPDLTVLLDVSADISMARVNARAGVDRIESAGDSFRVRLRQGFLDIAAANSDRFLVLDGTLPIPVLAGSVRKEVTDRLLRHRA